jgi:hypothetical protein
LISFCHQSGGLCETARLYPMLLITHRFSRSRFGHAAPGGAALYNKSAEHQVAYRYWSTNSVSSIETLLGGGGRDPAAGGPVDNGQGLTKMDGKGR